MRPLRDNRIHHHGFSLAELLVVIGITGILAVAVLPAFVNVLQTQQVRGAAQELVNLLNQARQLAIATNSRYRVEIDTANNRFCFKQSTDGGNTYSACIAAPGTDNLGYRRLENQAVLSTVNVDPTFNPFGTANNSTISVQDSRSSSSLGVVTSNTGRIRICPPDCP
jgi:prepilin-type N-terminal cleavage/methylation domain-containing protein